MHVRHKNHKDVLENNKLDKLIEKRSDYYKAKRLIEETKENLEEE